MQWACEWEKDAMKLLLREEGRHRIHRCYRGAIRQGDLAQDRCIKAVEVELERYRRTPVARLGLGRGRNGGNLWRIAKRAGEVLGSSSERVSLAFSN